MPTVFGTAYLIEVFDTKEEAIKHYNKTMDELERLNNDKEKEK